jgi:hypothetical protein
MPPKRSPRRQRVPAVSTAKSAALDLHQRVVRRRRRQQQLSDGGHDSGGGGCCGCTAPMLLAAGVPAALAAACWFLPQQHRERLAKVLRTKAEAVRGASATAAVAAAATPLSLRALGAAIIDSYHTGGFAALSGERARMLSLGFGAGVGVSTVLRCCGGGAGAVASSAAWSKSKPPPSSHQTAILDRAEMAEQGCATAVLTGEKEPHWYWGRHVPRPREPRGVGDSAPPGWLSKALEMLWPAFQQAAHRIAKEKVEPELRESMPMVRVDDHDDHDDEDRGEGCGMGGR